MTAEMSGAARGVGDESRLLNRVVGALLVLTVVVDVAFLAGLVATNGDNVAFVNVTLSLATQ